MHKFLITPIKDWAGRKYWCASYPDKESTSRRVQRKFNTLERAEAFLAEVKREWTRTGKVKLGLDRDLHSDVLRATKLLNGVRNATLERAVYVYLQCRSLSEKRGIAGGYEVSSDRKIELSPRIFLMVQNEARARKVTIQEAAEGLLAELALHRAGAAIRRQTQTEEAEYEELKKRNDLEWGKLRELRREDEIMRAVSDVNVTFELGRQSVLRKKAAYQKRWRARKKARESEVRTRNGY
jgi:hypothetical protein